MPDATRNEFVPSRENLAAIAEIFAELAIAAGAAIMRIYGGEANARAKADDSPVCDADIAAEAVILKGLAARLPQIPVISEEAAAAGARLSPCRTFILVDPLDGTREFLARNGEFTVNLALIVDGVPRAGVVYAPALGEIWIAGAEAFSAHVSAGEALPPLERRLRLSRRDARRRASSRLSADRTMIRRRKPIWRVCPSRKDRTPVLRSNSAGSRKASPMSIRDLRPRWNGTQPLAMQSCGRRVALCSILRAAPAQYGKFAEGLRNGPFVAWGDPSAAKAQAGAKTA